MDDGFARPNTRTGARARCPGTATVRVEGGRLQELWAVTVVDRVVAVGVGEQLDVAVEGAAFTTDPAVATAVATEGGTLSLTGVSPGRTILIVDAPARVQRWSIRVGEPPG